MSSRNSTGRRVRRRAWIRRVTFGLSVMVLAASLLTVVRRGEEGRRLMLELRGLDAEGRVVTDRIDAATARVDSLTAAPRIESAAERLGLRRASEEQLLQVDAGTGEGGDR